MTKEIEAQMFELRVMIDKLRSLTEILSSEIVRLDMFRLRLKNSDRGACFEYVNRLTCLAELQKSELLKLDATAEKIDGMVLGH